MIEQSTNLIFFMIVWYGHYKLVPKDQNWPVFLFVRIWVDLDVKNKFPTEIRTMIKQFESDGEKILEDFSDTDIKKLISVFKKALTDFSI